MKKLLTYFGLNLLIFSPTFGQDLYFPPIEGDTWETISMEELGWCPENLPALNTYLDDKNSRAFIVLKDGKIVIEEYYNGADATSLWYWASAGKTLTATMVGIAKQEGDLSLSDPTSTYLGDGWSSLTTEQEGAITIWNQLTMTSGLDDGLADPFCTDPECLVYLADPGDRWAYHNGPYTLLDGVIEGATGSTLNSYCNDKIEAQTGMDGLFIPVDYNNVYYSIARDMARFGLLILNEGNWDGTDVLSDATYYNEMVNPSQDLNKSYGYLWWLNGKESYMLPGSEVIFPGSCVPNAPPDMFAALGKNGQLINVVPSQNLVLIRMGDNPGGLDGLVSNIFNNVVWDYLNQIMCETSSSASVEAPIMLKMYPNPTSELLFVENSDYTSYTIYNQVGQLVTNGNLVAGTNELNTSNLEVGIYEICFENPTSQTHQRLVIH
ncbi:MAG: serine hydrolase [Crocinitomix sp.]|nr:serine hydrolase [Crocinitomix sp.]